MIYTPEEKETARKKMRLNIVPRRMPDQRPCTKVKLDTRKELDVWKNTTRSTLNLGISTLSMKEGECRSRWTSLKISKDVMIEKTQRTR